MDVSIETLDYRPAAALHSLPSSLASRLCRPHDSRRPCSSRVTRDRQSDGLVVLRAAHEVRKAPQLLHPAAPGLFHGRCRDHRDADLPRCLGKYASILHARPHGCAVSFFPNEPLSSEPSQDRWRQRLGVYACEMDPHFELLDAVIEGPGCV